MFIRRHWWAIVYSLFLAAFTVYLAMDTFVISRAYTVVTETESGRESTAAADTEQSNETGSDTEAVLSETFYRDENIEITITEYREYDTSIFVADIVLSSPEYLQTAFAKNAYGRNVTEKTSEIAESAGAILAINGDYYGAQEDGYVLRNGVLYRSTAAAGQEDLVIYDDGSFAVINETDITAEELLANGAQQILSFGSALIEDGTVVVSENDEVGKAKTSNPRTAVGLIDDLHYVFVVSDGRTDESAGLSLAQLAEFMKELGVVTAYNLDGGGSSTMYFNGQIINNPTTNGRSIKERSVSDIVYIGY
ncbi:phosphodiester glycosidase family protein [Massiliimalia massiliensis]|uniref:phosphodiester glycosidase family protein n=1 Tax=Massiliimalia massiliensis TaxID=1852384 RepID=UPI00117BDA30|nr:phosphodiester glycosidase family protein [Massiliimalia massiliensis]